MLFRFKSRQIGLAPAEIIIFVALICLLAAAAIPRVNPETAPKNNESMHVLGELKIGWSVAWAKKRANPDYNEIVASTRNFRCSFTVDTGITCPDVVDTNGALLRIGMPGDLSRDTIIRHPDLLEIL